MWTMLRKMGTVLVCVLVFGLSMIVVQGCATDPETGERIKAAAPTPPEAKLIASQIMRLALSGKNLSPEKMARIRTIMVDAKVVLVNALQTSPTTLDAVRLDYLKGKDPELAELADTVLQVLVLRLRPLIDQGKTDLAGQYIESVIDGAALAINAKIGMA